MPEQELFAKDKFIFMVGAASFPYQDGAADFIMHARSDPLSDGRETIQILDKIYQNLGLKNGFIIEIGITALPDGSGTADLIFNAKIKPGFDKNRACLILEKLYRKCPGFYYLRNLENGYMDVIGATSKDLYEKTFNVKLSLNGYVEWVENKKSEIPDELKSCFEQVFLCE